ncbi:fibrillarin, partial [Candidatus Micrarchaeota archaeon CG_4_10_14_0_8_um_filter_60_7]
MNPNLLADGNRLATRNLVKGFKVHGERLFEKNGEEWREWNPNRSKLAAAIAKGL